jgi:hypothetical protein
MTINDELERWEHAAMAYFMVLFQLLLQELKKSMISLSQN